MDKVRRSDERAKRRTDQMTSGGHEQNSRPKKSPTGPSLEAQTLLLDCNVRQTTSGSVVLPRTRVTTNTQAMVKLKGKVGLDHCNGPSDWTGRRVSRLSRNQIVPVPFVSVPVAGVDVCAVLV